MMIARIRIYPLLLFSLFILKINALAQPHVADGYMGLWYKYGKPYEYGYKFSGGLATFSSQHNPMAIFAPEVKKTFFVYCGTSGADVSHLQIMISYFDHRTHKVPRPVIVLDKSGVNDPQDNATLSIDSKGFIWIYVSGRGRTRPGYIFKSELPFSINKFEMISQDEIVFPQAWWMNDSCFLMMQSRVLKGRELYWRTSTDGKTWAPGKKLAGMGGHFQVTNIFENKLYSVFSYYPDGNIDKRTNLYLVFTDNNGKTWKTIDGKAVQTPLTDKKSDAIIFDYESEKKLVYIYDLNFDQEGNPVILALISNDFRPGPDAERVLQVIYRNDNQWNFSSVTDMPHNYNLGSLYTGEKDWRIICPTEAGPQKFSTGGEMTLWVSNDKGINWQKSVNITTNSVFNNSYARRPLNASKDFYAFWADGDGEKFSASRLYFTNEKCDKVWVLPYNMKKDFQKPVRIK